MYGHSVMAALKMGQDQNPVDIVGLFAYSLSVYWVIKLY
jgi:hypothetical protein